MRELLAGLRFSWRAEVKSMQGRAPPCKVVAVDGQFSGPRLCKIELRLQQAMAHRPELVSPRNREHGNMLAAPFTTEVAHLAPLEQSCVWLHLERPLKHAALRVPQAMKQMGLRLEREPEAARVVGDGAAPFLRRLLPGADGPLAQAAAAAAGPHLEGAAR